MLRNDVVAVRRECAAHRITSTWLDLNDDALRLVGPGVDDDLKSGVEPLEPLRSVGAASIYRPVTKSDDREHEDHETSPRGTKGESGHSSSQLSDVHERSAH